VISISDNMCALPGRRARCGTMFVNKKRILIGLCLIGFIDCNNNKQQLASTVQPPIIAPQVPAAPPVEVGPVLLSKDAKFWNFQATDLCRPQSEEDFLKLYSQTWNTTENEIQTKSMEITDIDLRNVKIQQLRKTINISKCKKEANAEYSNKNKAYQNDRLNYFQLHTSDWFEIAKLNKYNSSGNNPPLNCLDFKVTKANVLINYREGNVIEFEFDIAQIDRIFSKFKENEIIFINNKSNENFSKAMADGEAVSMQNYGMSMKAHWLSEGQYVPGGRSESDWNNQLEQEKKEFPRETEKELRYEMLFLVASGDIIHNKIDKLAIYSYNSGKIVEELQPEFIVKMLKPKQN